MHLRRQQKPINEDKAAHLVAGQLEVFDMVGKPLPTSFAGGEDLKMVSERLGHASPVVTMTVYAHVLPGRQRQATERFAAAIEEGRS